MKQIEVYRKDGRLALRHMWYIILLFSFVQVILSCIVAAKNSEGVKGYKSASFAAIWGMFVVIAFEAVAWAIVFHTKSSELLVGFMIGTAFMLAELFFVLMMVFFIIGTEAESVNPPVGDSDKAYGAFAFFNTIIYLLWGSLLMYFRSAVISEEVSNKDVIIEEHIEGETYNDEIDDNDVDYDPSSFQSTTFTSQSLKEKDF